MENKREEKIKCHFLVSSSNSKHTHTHTGYFPSLLSFSLSLSFFFPPLKFATANPCLISVSGAAYFAILMMASLFD